MCSLPETWETSSRYASFCMILTMYHYVSQFLIQHEHQLECMENLWYCGVLHCTEGSVHLTTSHWFGGVHITFPSTFSFSLFCHAECFWLVPFWYHIPSCLINHCVCPCFNLRLSSAPFLSLFSTRKCGYALYIIILMKQFISCNRIASSFCSALKTLRRVGPPNWFIMTWGRFIFQLPDISEGNPRTDLQSAPI